MKKLISLILCALLALSLLGCSGGNTASAETTAAPAATAVPATEAPAATAAPVEATEAPVEATGSDGEDAALLETVRQILDLIDQPVEDLYDLIGQPVREGEYTSSCLVTGGQDGQLEYDGFTVYTIVQPDGTETVYDILKPDGTEFDFS